MYLNLLLMLVALAFAPNIRQRLDKLPRGAVFVPIVLMLAWTTFIALAGNWYPDTATRLFHIFRVALVLLLGTMLTPSEARAALSATIPTQHATVTGGR